MKIACCIFSYNITKGMKSIGPIGALKKNNKSKNLIVMQIEYLRKIFKNVDIYVVTGFGADKITKILNHKKTVDIIYNPEYETKNYGHALKLFLDHIDQQNIEYDGLFCLDSNIVVRSLGKKQKQQSWAIVQKHRKNKNKKDYLGININSNNYIQQMFYNVGDYRWCKGFYLTKQDFDLMIKNKDMYHDNMFIFEILNDLIDNHHMQFSTHLVTGSSNFTEILGIKDKSKIK